METVDNQVAVINNSIELLKTAPQILQANQIRKDKAIQVGKNILAAIASGGMTQEIDERAMKFLANASKAGTEMKDERAGVTQIMDSLKKMYTEVENELDSKRPGTVSFQLQGERDKYAKHVAIEKEQKRREAQLKADREKEAIELKASIEIQFSDFYNDYLLTKKQALQNNFNAIALDDFEDKSSKLKAFTPLLNVAFSGSFKPKVHSTIHNASELIVFTNEVMNSKTEDFKNNYVTELSLLCEDLVEKLPSKLKELQEKKRLDDEQSAELERQRKAKEKSDAAIAAASAAEKKRLEKQAEIDKAANDKKLAEMAEQKKKADEETAKRQKEEADKIAAENEDNKKKAELDVDIKKQGEQTMAMFEQEATNAEIETGPEARQGYEIEVVHPVGYTQIFALWFEHEGKNLGVDKIGNTKLDQMKAWAEKKALKDGTKIESKFLKYNDVFKAVNRKAK